MDGGEEFWFAGADPDKQVHGFIMKPHGYEKGKKYGMIFLVHGTSELFSAGTSESNMSIVAGGPQSAWTDSW